MPWTHPLQLVERVFELAEASRALSSLLALWGANERATGGERSAITNCGDLRMRSPGSRNGMTRYRGTILGYDSDT